MLADLTAEQEKALIDAATVRRDHWSDAWERGYTDEQRAEAKYFFLAGVRWAQREKR
jgi:hypothetical protein